MRFPFSKSTFYIYLDVNSIETIFQTTYKDRGAKRLYLYMWALILLHGKATNINCIDLEGISHSKQLRLRYK